LAPRELKSVDDSSPSSHETMAEMADDVGRSTTAKSREKQQQWGIKYPQKGGGR
jgi:hypothetical protein